MGTILRIRTLVDQGYVPRALEVTCRGTKRLTLSSLQVLASYIQQLAIVLLSWTFLRIPQMCLAIRKRCSGPAAGHMFTSPKKKPLWTKVAALSEHSATSATINTLKDFQEAQIFFSITLNVATIVALYKSETRLMAPTIAELVANRFLFKAIGAIGSYPVVLNLCILHNSGRILDHFILIASACCVFFATVTWSLAIATTLESNQLQRDEYRFGACGDENPMRYCFGNLAVDKTIEWWTERWSLTVFAQVFLSAPAIAVPILVLAGLVVKKMTSLRTRSMCQEANVRSTPYGVLDRVLGIFLTIAELWLLLSTVMLLLAVSFLMVPVSHRQPHWQIGQILAVAVWLPVLMKWLHELYGTSISGSACSRSWELIRYRRAEEAHFDQSCRVIWGRCRCE